MHPGKQLLFMGNEIAVRKEWQFADSLDWSLLQYPEHKGVQKLVSDLNAIYKQYPALYENDFESNGFEWIDGNDFNNSIVSDTLGTDTDFSFLSLFVLRLSDSRNGSSLSILFPRKFWCSSFLLKNKSFELDSIF